MNTDKFYQIALTLVPKVADVAVKKLMAYCGSIENVLKIAKNLICIAGLGVVIANSIVSQKAFSTRSQRFS